MKNLGDPKGYATEAEAKARLAEIESFKTKADGAELLEVHRVDRGELRSPERLANGWVRADAYLTRTGVFSYRNADGTMRREYRPPAEVFKADSLQTFALAPLTDEHPPTYLDAENTREYARGSVSAPRQDGDHVRATLLVTDAELIAKMDAGEARQVSCGYKCQLEVRAGVSPEGEHFDAIQRSIVGNHVAVVPVGRAGASASVRMDAADLAVLCLEGDGGKDPATTFPTSKEDHVKNTIKIAGISFQTDDATLAQAFEKFDADTRAQIAGLEKQIAEAKGAGEKLQAKLDAETEQLAKAKEELKTLPEKLRADAKARLVLEGTAKKVLGDKAKLDALKDDEIRAKVLAKLSPKLDTAGKSAEYIGARFDAAIEAFEAAAAEEHADEGERTVADLRAAAEDREDDESDGDDNDEPAGRVDAQGAYERMLKDNAKRAASKA